MVLVIASQKQRNPLQVVEHLQRKVLDVIAMVHF